MNPANEPYLQFQEKAIDTMGRLMGDRDRPEAGDKPLAIGRLISFGDVWNRPHLDVRDRRIATLTILALEAPDTTIALHVRGALQNGDLSVDDLDELALQIAVYAGFPRASNFGKIVRAEAEAFEERAH